MRLIIAAGAALLMAAPAIAQPYHHYRDPLPHNERALQRLNNEQLRIVRRSIQICAQPGLSFPIRAERNPCVISNTDKAISDSDDPALQAFHDALPEKDRYDENRDDTVWRAFLVDYND